jgi:2-succinyl-5-enolpyruvyl-6-hydroxy-3-cyclohexene-1-carboxylate synthase
MQTDPAQRNRNACWADVILDECRRAGVTRAVVCPGGRSAALVMGFARAGITVAHVGTDERSAGFFALGLAKASGRPVAVCVTSGSAVANLLPALTEADPLGIRLILLTADRPGGGRAIAMPQTADHIGLCAAAVRESLSLPDPDASEAGFRALRQAVAGLLARLDDPARCGPVQINIPLHGVFTSADADPGWTPPELPAREVPETARVPAAVRCEVPDHPLLRAGRRGLVVAGPDLPVPPELVSRLGAALGYPLLADAASGLRRPEAANLVSTADLLAILPATQRNAPEVVIRIGGPPVSLMLQRYLAASGAAVLRLTRDHVTGDFLSGEASWTLDPEPASFAALAARLAPGDPDWCRLWLDQDHAARTAIPDAVAALPWGECVAAHIVSGAAEGYGLFHVANSMSARHANLFVAPGPGALPVFMNRGVNGIDGTVSTFLGEVAATGARGLLLIGDEAMLHDITGLEAAREALRGTICVMNNGGGSLFDLFGLPSLPDHRRLIRNPTTVRFAAIAEAFGLTYVRCESAPALRAALREATQAHGLRLVEIMVEPGSLARDLPAMIARIAGS